jgi:signal transduction histidine kinase
MTDHFRRISSLPSQSAFFARSLTILPEMGLIGCCAVLLLGLLSYGAMRQDDVAQEAATQIVNAMLRREMADLSARADDLTWWSRIGGPDGLVVGDGGRGLLRQITERYNVDLVMAFDDEGRLRRGPTGMSVPPNGAAALLARARGAVAGAVREDGAPPLAVTGVVQSPRSGGLALAAVGWAPRVMSALVADSPQRAAPYVLLVREFSAEALVKLGREHGVADLAVAPLTQPPAAAPPAAVVLRAADGQGVGALTWGGARPGEEMLRRVIAPVVLVLLLMGGLALLALHRSNTSSRGMREAKEAMEAANRELVNSRRRFRDFAEAASDWFWETDADLHYVYVSERLAAILGRPAETALGAGLDELGKLAGDSSLRMEVGEAVAARRAFRDIEISYEEPEGEGRTFIFRISGQPCFNDAGDFTGYRGSGVDASAETLALVEARFMQILVHDALDSVSEGFVLFNADGRLAVCNQRYREAYPNIADVLIPGVTFEEVLRVAAERGGFLDDGVDLASWVRRRLERHLDNAEPVDRLLSDGRWYRISEHATRSGGVVKLLMDITELKEREQELAGQTARLKATLDSISHGVGMFDRDGALAAWNEDFPRLLEMGRRSVTFGRPLADFAEKAAELSPVLAAAFSPRLSATEDLPRDAVKAGDRFLEVRRSAIPEGGFVVSLADVSERHRVETALRDLAQAAPGGGDLFFRTLASALARSLGADAVWVGEALPDDRARLLGCVVDGVAATEATEYPLEGTPCARVIGRSFSLFPRGVRALFPHDPRLAALEAESYCAAPLFDSGGRPLGHVAVIGRRPLVAADYVKNLLHLFAARAAAEMERRRTINALKESEGRYRQLVELAPYGIAIWDRKAIRFANSAAAAMLGGESGLPAAPGVGPVGGPGGQLSGLEGARLAPFFEDGDKLEAALGPEGQEIGRQGVRLECAALRPSGERRYIELGAYGAVFRGDDAVLLVFNDITERRRAEAELQRSQKMEAVGRMAGGVAHEFNNMLTAIGGFARLAERSPGDSERVLTCVREIAKASDRAAALTGQLLDFSRRRVTDELETVELGAMVRDLRVFLKPLISAGVELDLDIRVEPVFTVANPVTLNQALLNLAINARDAMPDGGALTITLDRMGEKDEARLRLADKLPAGPCVLIRVADNGCGIADDVRDRIWEPFFTTKDLGKGTGLGLWMVYGAVEQAGGVIDLETEVGVGTVFSIYLPEAAAPEAQADWRAPLLDDGEAACILLVDDEDSVRAFLRLALEEAGCVVTEACDGRDALEKFDEAGGLFDAVVTDISMPHMNGADMAHALAERNSELRILFLTGYASRDKAAGLQAHPGWKLLMKPIDPERLVEAVRSLIRE